MERRGGGEDTVGWMERCWEEGGDSSWVRGGGGGGSEGLKASPRMHVEEWMGSADG